MLWYVRMLVYSMTNVAFNTIKTLETHKYLITIVNNTESYRMSRQLSNSQGSSVIHYINIFSILLDDTLLPVLIIGLLKRFTYWL